MSFVVTWVLTAHEDDTETVAKLNKVIGTHYDALGWNASDARYRFRELGAFLPRADTAEFFAMHSNNLTVDQFVGYMNSVPWNHKTEVSVSYRTENMKSWGNIQVSGTRFEIDPEW